MIFRLNAYRSLTFCYLLVLLFLVSLPTGLFSQTIRINYVNTDNYPVIEAGFVATTSDGIKIYNSRISDFTISENGYKNEVIEVTNPEQHYQPVSIVLMVDVSLSMKGRRTTLVKEALVDFIDQIPLEVSEVALACFSDEAYIYSDFTQSRNKLVTSLDKLNNLNGTNFDNAFMDAEQGALEIAKNGRHKKAVVFITDGLGETDTAKVTAMAKQLGSSIYTLNIGTSIPEDLKNITEKSGGRFFDKIWNHAQFRTAAATIFRELKCTDYGTVKWLSKLDCESIKPLQLKYRNTRIEFDFEVPTDKIGKIEVNPSIIQFGIGKAGLEQSQNINISVKNIPVTLKGLQLGTLANFKIAADSILPQTIKPGEIYSNKILFSSPDAGLYESKLTMSFEECPDVHINVAAGGKEKLVLLFPKGGETFNIEADTSIIWDGIKRTQNVEMYYRLTEQQPWKYINKAKGLNYLWSLPSDTSTQAQVKLTPQRNDNEKFEISAVIDGNNSPVLNAFYGPDGSKIITTDKNGFVKTWNTETGKIITSLGGYEAKKAIITPDNERIILLVKDEIFIWNMSTDKLTGRTSTMNKKVNTALIFPDGHQLLTSGNVSVDPAKNARIWSSLNSYKTFLMKEPDVKWATFSPDGKQVITLDNKNTIKIFNADSATLVKTFSFKETVNDVIVSPDGQTACVKFAEELRLLDLNQYTEIYRIPEIDFQQFTSSGNYFISGNTGKSIRFYETSTGKNVLTINQPKFYKVSNKAEFVAYSRQDTFFIFNFKTLQHTLIIPLKPVRIVNFDTNDTKIYLLTLNNALEIFDTETGSFLGVMDGFSRNIKEIFCSPAKSQLAFLMDDNRIEIWSPGTILKMDDVISGRFTITSPKPEVIDTINFGIQQIHSRHDIIENRFAWNSTKYPINIKKAEITGTDAAAFKLISNNFPQKIEANSQLAQEFSFEPSSATMQQARVLTITATDTFNTVIIGSGINPTIKPLIHHLDFGKLKVGLFKDTLAAVLVNIGKDTLYIAKISNFGPDDKQFKILSDKSESIAPNDTLKALVRFSPVFRGKTTTNLMLAPLSDDYRIIVRGEGIAPRELIIVGTTRNSEDSTSISALVKKIDLAVNRNMEEIVTGNDGKFIFNLSADRNFGLVAEKENFFSSSINIDLSEKTIQDTIYQDIYLTEIKPGAIIRFNCIFFEFDKPTLLPGSQADLHRLLELILKYKNISFEIHGHTDSQGPEAYNLNLSKARATAIMNYLVKNGASKEKLSVKFFGETKPIATNETEEGRALNRRVELKVLK